MLKHAVSVNKGKNFHDVGRFVTAAHNTKPTVH